MITELSIRNFAIIEDVQISFQNGLTVLTGETGAGKSIIIDAIGLLVGGRGSSEFVRYGAEKAEIEGLFYIDHSNHPLFERAEEYGITIDDGMILLKRELLTNGKSVCRINGKLVTLTILRDIGRTLIDIHSQHEHQDLLNSDRHLFLLDSFGEDKISPIMTKYREELITYKEVKAKYQSLTENEQKLAHRLDLIQFQLEEISSAGLVIGEDEQLEEEKQGLVHFEKIYKNTQESYYRLENENGGLDSIRQAIASLESVSDLDSTIKTVLEQMQSSYYILEEVSYGLRDRVDNMEFQPHRLEEIEDRLGVIRQLKRKYGSTIEEILTYEQGIIKELDQIQNKDFLIQDCVKQLEATEINLQKYADQLSEERKIIAEILTKEITAELQELYMEKTVFSVTNTSTTTKASKTFKDDGTDQIEFYISTNPGEPLKPLGKIASGGELSRIMLALKSIFSKHQGVTSIIFDEVDTGVSGRVAQAIAEKIHHVSEDSQVLCISHLPQVAAMADQHLFIAKEIEEGRTRTSVSTLTFEEQTRELARMITGVETTETTLQHAREMLNLSKQMKTNRRVKETS